MLEMLFVWVCEGALRGLIGFMLDGETGAEFLGRKMKAEGKKRSGLVACAVAGTIVGFFAWLFSALMWLLTSIKLHQGKIVAGSHRILTVCPILTFVLPALYILCALLARGRLRRAMKEEPLLPGPSGEKDRG